MGRQMIAHLVGGCLLVAGIAYGGGSSRCVVGSIRKAGAPQRIGVRCFTAGESKVAEAAFTLAYAR